MAVGKFVAIKSPRKLIEVALPLDKINAACAHEKMPGIGAHPRGIHLWWARRPLAAARAILFAQLVNDPGYERSLNRGVNKVEAAHERERLFKIIEDLVLWENTNDTKVLAAARAEIWNSWRETCDLNRHHPAAEQLFNREKLPVFHDPFAGGGAIPLEAQRLGLESFASDLNPVAVTINKAMIEIPPMFAGREPLGPIAPGEREQNLSRTDWPGASGLAEDVRRYGLWMRDEARKRIGDVYPKILVTDGMATERPDLQSLVGQNLTVIAWLWARTVKSPNPAYSEVDVPLISNFILSTKPGREAYLQAEVVDSSFALKVKVGAPPPGSEKGTKLSGRATFKCVLSDTPIETKYIKSEANAGRMSSMLIGIVAEGKRGRVYLSPDATQEAVARQCVAPQLSQIALPNDARAFTPILYGFDRFEKLFIPRQLVVLDALSTLVKEAMDKCRHDVLVNESNLPLDSRESVADKYATAVGTYLAFAVDRCADFSNSFTRWVASNEKVMNLFARQAIAMTWDFPEANVLADTVGGFYPAARYISECIAMLPHTSAKGTAWQADAASADALEQSIISTDPPYYDNIGYADLSDFFYMWLRRGLRDTSPSLFATMAVPKADELVATAYRHGGEKPAEAFFLQGMEKAIRKMAQESHPAFPLTIYYAFRQSDTQSDDQTSSTGWETFISAVLRAGLLIDGTWPIRSEQSSRIRGADSNALASSIVLVCRKRDEDAPTTSRAQFLRELQATLPDALIEMTRGGENSPVAPVDLSQAIIGPGIGIFSRYRAVLEADGKAMSVRTALQLINRFLADDEFDAETQFCLQWLESYGWKSTDYGFADTLAQAKGAVLSQMNREGLLASGGGEVKLIRWQELDTAWKPERQNSTPIWQALHQLIANLQEHGEQSTGVLLAAMPAVSGRVRTLAYRLYTLAVRKNLAEDARPYNELIGAWSAIEMAAAETGPIETQVELF